MKWGFIGFGKIARKLKPAIELLESEQIVAIASRSNYEKLRISMPSHIRVYDSYDLLYQNPEVDIVYVNTTHHMHKQNVMAALDSGKHVLCEKPMGLTHQEVIHMTGCAEKNQLFLMEAMWTRFLPAYRKMIEIIGNGQLGEIIHLQAGFSFRAPSFDPSGRLFNPVVGGGAILDVGIYPISLMLDVFQELPTEISASGKLTDEGIDGQCSMFFKFSNDRSAHLQASIITQSPCDAIITGTKGWIRMADFWRCVKLEVSLLSRIAVYEYPHSLNGYEYQIAEVTKSIGDGRTEHTWMDRQSSLQIAQIMDKVMTEVGYSNI